MVVHSSEFTGSKILFCSYVLCLTFYWTFANVEMLSFSNGIGVNMNVIRYYCTELIN